MKKKLICSMMSIALGVLTVSPTIASADTVKEDVNKDGVVSYEDYNLVVKSNGWDGSYDLNNDYKVDQKDLNLIKAAIVPTGIKGDINCDGVISIEDDNLYRAIFEQASYKLVDVDGVSTIVIDASSVKYGYDFYNADMDNDGYIGPHDQAVLNDRYHFS